MPDAFDSNYQQTTNKTQQQLQWL